jgi:hypothetical protein
MNPRLSPSKGTKLTFCNQEPPFKDCVDEGRLDAYTHEKLTSSTKISYQELKRKTIISLPVF